MNAKCEDCGEDFVREAGRGFARRIYCKRPNCKRAAQRKYKIVLVNRNEEYVYKDKMRGCSRCSERRPSTIEYHHLNPAEKKNEVARLMWDGMSLELLKAEIAKCILLCANCHKVEEWGDGFKD